MKERIIWVLWPSFVVAAAAEMLFFALIDPGELHLFGNPVEASRTAIYSTFFFLFWAMGACSSALTCMLQRSPFEVNRCPLDPAERPGGCPKRTAGACCD